MTTSHHSEDRGERPVEEPGEWALVVVDLTANPGLSRRLVIREWVDWSRTPRVGCIAVSAMRSFFDIWAQVVIQIDPLVLEEEALVAEKARGELRLQMDVRDVLPASLELAVSERERRINLAVSYKLIFLNANAVRSSTLLGLLACPDLKQSCVGAKGHQLIVEGNHLSLVIEHAVVGEQASHIIVRNELQVSGEPHMANCVTIDIETREFCQADGANLVLDLFKLSFDCRLITPEIKVTNVSLELVGEEVVAATRSPGRVCDVVDGGHAVSSEFEGGCGREAIKLWYKEVAF